MNLLPKLFAPANGDWLSDPIMLRSLPLLRYPFLLVGIAEIVRRCSPHVQAAVWEVCRHNRAILAFSLLAALICAAILGHRKWPRPVYLVDFACYRPEDTNKSTYELSEYFTRQVDRFNVPSMEFQRKIFFRSGLGNETYIPSFIFNDPPNANLSSARSEAMQVIFGSIDELLIKTGVKPADIGILVTNCSVFNPTPSHSAMIINRYKMNESIKAFHLSGMGCSGSVVGCQLIKDLLKTYPDQYALLVSYENITLNWYFGNNKSMLVTNCLFRVGCAAILLTNKRSERSRSKYELLHCVRTHKAADDKAFRCAHQTADEDGTLGVALSPDLMGVAADALRTNISTLGPLVLPFSEQFLFMFSLLCKKLLKLKVKQYQPDFKLVFDHFCLHPGGRAVIDEVQKNLFLTDEQMAAARATLHRFGNTSASCLWYVFAYMEAKQQIKKGDKVWMLGLGSGFKCNTAVWKALLDIPMPVFSPWLDCIHRYPAAAQEGVGKVR